MTDEYKIKGSSIRSKFLFVRETFGEAAEQNLTSRFDARFFPVLDGNWYDYSFYESVIRAITTDLLNGNAKRLEEVGAFSAQSTLTGVYRFLIDKRDFAGFLRRAEKLHESCYNQGGMTVTFGDDGTSCTIRLSAPVFREFDMHISAGFYSGAARLLGAKNVTCRCTLLDNAADFHLRWS